MKFRENVMIISTSARRNILFYDYTDFFFQEWIKFRENVIVNTNQLESIIRKLPKSLKEQVSLGFKKNIYKKIQVSSASCRRVSRSTRPQVFQILFPNIFFKIMTAKESRETHVISAIKKNMIKQGARGTREHDK
jgi:hypothetical protein